MRKLLVAAVMVVLGGCCGSGGDHAVITDAGGGDLAELTCSWRDGWVCVDGTPDCIGPDGSRRRVWEAPIYCCAGELVAPALGADLGGGGACLK